MTELKIGRRVYETEVREEGESKTVVLKWTVRGYTEFASFTTKNGQFFFNPGGKMGGSPLTRDQKKIIQDKLNSLMEEGAL